MVRKFFEFYERKGDLSEEPIFSIGSVARMLNLHQQTIREYEKEGLLKPKRTAGGTRMYSQVDIERIRFISMLTQELGVNLAGVQIIMSLREDLNQMLRLTETILSQLDASLKERILRLIGGEEEGLLRITPQKAGLILKRKIPIDEGEHK